MIAFPTAERGPKKTADARVRWLFIVASLLVILGAKIWSIAFYGSATPFWDQWDAEAAGLYPPYLAGTLRLSDLAAPHNEHRILLTRLFALVVFVGSGRWDPILQMLYNAVVHTAAIGLLLAMLSRILDRAGTALLAFFCAIAFAVPYGWGNSLSAFQTQFYLLVLLGPLALFLLYDAAAWSARWWLGTLVALVGYFSIASGALTLPAFIGLAVIQLILGVRAGRNEWLGVGLHVVFAAALIYDVPRIPEHAELRAQSALDFIDALAAAASWPVTAPQWPLLPLGVGACLLYAPVLVITGRLLRRPAPLTDRHWLLFSFACWIGLQLAAAAYGRGMGAMNTRYLDIYILGVVLNAACVIWLALVGGGGLRAFAVLWLIAVMMGGSTTAFDELMRGITWRRDTAARQTENLKRFIATGDASALQNKPIFDIPYPLPEKLIAMASDPAIRAILPAHLRGELEVHTRRDTILRHGALLIPLGLALFMIAGMASRSRTHPGGP
jgi:hypothetical protein